MTDERLPEGGGTLAYGGSSMFPLLQPGDLVEFRPARPEDAAVGDCVVYRGTTGELTVHRVVAPGRRLVTRGDNRPLDDDEPVDPERFVGLATCRTRAGGRTRIRGGRRGAWLARLRRQALRLDPNGAGRGGAVGRLVRRCCSPVAWWLRGSVRIIRFGRRAGTLLMLGNRGIGTWDEERATWAVWWPWCLLFGEHDFPARGHATATRGAEGGERGPGRRKT